jgi:hypothetical protein
MSSARVKFATEINTEILSAVRDLAQREGRQLEDLVEEALSDLNEKRRQGKPCAEVMAAYQDSHETFGSLYKKLAD